MGSTETPTASPRAAGGAEADALEALLNMRSIAANETRGERVLQVAGSDRLASHQGSLGASETDGHKDSFHQPQKPNVPKLDVNVDSTTKGQQQSLPPSEAAGAPGSRSGSFTGKKRKPLEGNEDEHSGSIMMRSADGRSGPITLGERLMASAAGSRPANDGGRRFSHVLASTYDGVQDAGWRVASEPTGGGDEERLGERLRLGRIPSEEDAAHDRLHNHMASGSSGAGSETPPSAKRLHVARLQQAAGGGAGAAGGAGAGAGGAPGGAAWQHQQAGGPGASFRRASLSESDGPAAAAPQLPNQPSPQQKVGGGGGVAAPPSLPRVALRAVRNCNPPSPLGQGSDTGSDPGSPSGGPAAWCPSPGRVPLGDPPTVAAAAGGGGGGKATDSAGGGNAAAAPDGEDVPPSGSVRTGSVISLLHMLAIRQQQQQQQQQLELGRQRARSGVGHDVGMEDVAMQGAPDRLERHPTLDPAGLQQVQPHPSHARSSDAEAPPPPQGPAGRRPSASASRGGYAPNPGAAQPQQLPQQQPPLIRGSSLPSRDRSHAAPLDPRDREYGAQQQEGLWMERELGREQRPAAQRGHGPAPPSLSGELPPLGHSQSHVTAPVLLPPRTSSFTGPVGGGAGRGGDGPALVRHVSDVAQRERERERDWAVGGVAEMEGVVAGRGGTLHGPALGHPLQGGVAAPTDDPQRVTASLANIERKLLMQEQRLIFELQQVRLMQKLLQVQQMKQRVREAMLLHEQDGAAPMDATPFTTGGGISSGAAASGPPVARGLRAASVTGPAASRSAVYGELEGMDSIRSGSEPYMRHRPPVVGQQHGPAAGGGGVAGRQHSALHQQQQRGLVGDRHEDSRHGPLHGPLAEPVGVGGDGSGTRAAGLDGRQSGGGGGRSGGGGGGVGGGGEALQGGVKEAAESLSSRLLSYMAAMSSKGGEGDARAFQWRQECQTTQQQQQLLRDPDLEQLLRHRGQQDSEEPPPLPPPQQKQQQQQQRERDRQRELQVAVQGPRESAQVKGEMMDGPTGMEQ